MATYKHPGQNIEYQVPDDGEVFLIDDRGWSVGVRQGNNVTQYNLEEIGRNALLQEDPNWKGDGATARSKAQQIFQQQGINLGGAKYYDTTPWQRNEIGSFQKGTDLSLLNSKATSQGEVFTRGVSATNPNASTLNSSVSGDLSKASPKYGDPNAINPTGMTPQQMNPAGFGQTQQVQQPTSFGLTDPNRVVNTTTGQVAGQMISPTYRPAATLNSGNMQGGATTNYGTPTGNASAVNGALAAANATAAANAQAAQAQQEAATKLGAKETDLSRMIAEAMGGNDAMSGRAAYQTEQNKAFGVTTAQMTKNSLEAKQRALLAKAAAIDLEVQQGQGVTTAIDQRQKAEAKRLIAIESLINTALIAAADGDLANAKAQADEAVALKYDPIEEKQKIRLANLDLLSKDPNITVEEQKRAAAAAATVKAQDAVIAQKKADETEAFNIAVAASAKQANFTPTAQYKTAAEAIDAMTKSSKEQALAIAIQTGLAGASKNGQWSEPFYYQGNYVQKNSLTNEYRTAVNPPEPGNGLTGEQLKQSINKQIATPEFKSLSQEEKEAYIQSQGGNPYDFTF